MPREGRSITCIPAVKKFAQTAADGQFEHKRRVAAYARVSTDIEEQLSSYAAQVDYYTNYIQSRQDWEFVKVYTDEGISGTNTKYREGFKQMIADALAGKIDLIVTKSVSRFARNTVDSLTAVRQLKEHGVEIFFEKENIWTFDSKGELLITIMSSLAQEESRSISENTTWGWRKRFADGQINLPYKSFLGYRKGEDGLPEIVEEEAAQIRLIFSKFMEGYSYRALARYLESVGIKSPSGKSTWNDSTLKHILANEKYRGSAILQKSFTTDFLTKKKKKNEGEVPQYYIEHSHEPIIDPKEFDEVQAEIARRSRTKTAGKGAFFSTMIKCGDCGGFYGAKVWHSNDKYRKIVWRCNNKYDNAIRCTTPSLTEQELLKLALTALDSALQNKDEIIENCRLGIAAIADIASLDIAIETSAQYLESLAMQCRDLIKTTSRNIQVQDEYLEKYAALKEKYDQAQEKHDELEKKRADMLYKRSILEKFVNDFSEFRPEQRLNKTLMVKLVNEIIIFSDGRVIVEMKNGMQITTQQ